MTALVIYQWPTLLQEILHTDNPEVAAGAEGGALRNGRLMACTLHTGVVNGGVLESHSPSILRDDEVAAADPAATSAAVISLSGSWAV